MGTDGVGQPLARDLPDRLWDAVVVGAGPAGSACALRLAEQGHAVALVDRESFPRSKVCGGGLIADAVAALARLGVLDDVQAAAHPLDTLSLFSPSQIEVRAHGAYLTLERADLDAILARCATKAGAHLCRGTVEAVTVDPSGAAVARVAGGPALRARVAVLATGARLALPARLGMVPPSHAAPDAVAVCRIVRSHAQIDRLVASFDRSVLPGYAWIFPLGGGRYNLGCGIFHRSSRKAPPDLKQTLDAFVREFPLAREVLARAEAVGPLRGAPLRCGLRGAAPLAAGPVLAVGETIGATFPFTGEGIGKALHTGELAARAIDVALVRGDLGALRCYPDALDAELRPKYWGYEIAEAWIRWPWLIDFMSRRVKKSRHLQAAARGILQETTDPRSIFSVAGIVQSLRS
ncbi:MAG: NAD(P)/FAD-dependent oxidoreductase [Deltaproteobacteria bacterium]|nr:NAD(P)/FAD-dependent oxidoreductase [Deltaproteobacteria bacterium]